jgi:urease accessory protein
MNSPAHTLAVTAFFFMFLAMTNAAAHPVYPGIGGFPGGLLHPLLVPTHLIALVALGLLIGWQPRWGWAVAAVYGIAVIAGLGAIALGTVPILAEEALLALAGISGLLVVLALPLPGALGGLLAAATGLVLALDSPPDAILLREANLALLGTALGASMMLVAVVQVASRLRRDWQRIGVRILGSWIAASAILVLALRFAR